jgi:MFS family permease
MALAAAPALLLVPALLAIREPARAPAAAPPPLGAVLRMPAYWWIVASGAVQNFILYALFAFLTSFLIRVHGFAIGSTGLIAGALVGTGGLAGGLLAGRVGDRVVSRKDGRMLAASLAAFLSAPAAAAGILLADAAVALPLIGVAYCLLTMYYGLVYASLQDIVPPSLRASALAFYFLLMYVCGASFGPLVTGALSDWLARRAAGGAAIGDAARAIGLQQAMLVIPALALVLASVLYGGARAMRRGAGGPAGERAV